MDDILYSSDGNKGNELASAVKNEFECVKRNNEATSKYDYNQAYNNSRVSSLYNIFQGNENKAKEENIDKSNSNIVNSYSKSYRYFK